MRELADGKDDEVVSLKVDGAISFEAGGPRSGGVFTIWALKND